MRVTATFLLIAVVAMAWTAHAAIRAQPEKAALEFEVPVAAAGGVSVTVDCTLANTSSTSEGRTTANFTSLTDAQSYIRGARGSGEIAPGVHVTVLVTGPCYTSLALDGSLGDSNVTWKAAASSATSSGGDDDAIPTIVAGVKLDPKLWTSLGPVTTTTSNSDNAEDQHQLEILAYPLSSVDLGSLGIGGYFNGGLGQCAQTRAELFIAGAPMTVARYPNAPLTPGVPWMDWIHVGDVGATSARDVAGGSIPECGDHPRRLRRHAAGATPTMFASHDGTQKSNEEAAAALRCWWSGAHETSTKLSSPALGPTAFSVSDIPLDVAKRIAATPPTALARAWAHGFWAFDWADNYIQLSNATIPDDDRAANLTLQYNPATPPVYQMLPRARFYLTNLRSELDAEGEYFFDEENNMLLLVIQGGNRSKIDPRQKHAFISTNASGITGSSLVNVAFDGIHVAYARGNGIVIQSSSHVSVRGGSASNVGWNGLVIDGCSDVNISGLVSINAGCHGVGLSGGNHFTLAPANMSIEGSVITQYARWTRTYNPGVSFSGVGITVARNFIGRGPHNGLLGGGNNHLFENNTLFDLCYEVRDSDAFYIGRSWVDRGMVLRGNTFINITALEPTFLGADSVQAMYFDDEQSGVTAENNICRNVHACFLVGGGRDNIVRGNICESVQSSCILFDNRGMNWQKAICTNSTVNGPGLLVQQLEQVHYQQPPYSVAYPSLPDTMQDRPCVPVGNVFDGNQCCGCTSNATVVNQAVKTIEGWGSVAQGNLAGGCHF